MKIKIKLKQLQLFCLFLYFLALSSFNLATELDKAFTRISFVLLISLTLINEFKIKITGHLKWLILFWGFYFLSMTWASNSNDTLRYVNECIQILGVSICLSSIIQNGKELDNVLNMVVFSLLGTSLRLFLMTPQSVWGSERLGEAIGMNSNALGMRMAIGSVISLYMLRKNFDIPKPSRKFYKIFFYAAMIVLLSGIALFTGSRKTVGIIIIGLAAYEVLTTKGWRILVKIAVVITVAAIFLYFIFNNETLYMVIGKRLNNMVLALTGQGSGGWSIIERRYYREQAKTLFLKYPLLGYGGNNFMTYMREIRYSHIAYSHNNYLEMLSTLGIVGFVIYYYIWLHTEIKLIKLYIRRKDNHILLFTVLIGMEFILGYWYVSYMNVFTQMIFVLGYIVMKMNCSKK